jgi:UDP-N-acetylglucosamine 2-epimerase
MLKVMTILGTRPELIKMSRVIYEFDQYVNHVLVHTGQNYDYELNQIFFNELNIRKPDHFLGASGATTAAMIASIIEKSDEVMAMEEPDAILFYGDTNSCLGVIAAKRRHIPVFHMEAGNRCFDQRVPEEINRKILDHLSDINLVLTEHARRYLIAEGVAPNTIIKTGSHMREVLDFHMRKINSSDVVERMKLKVGEYFLVSAHREENVDTPENLTDLLQTLNALAETHNKAVVVSTHPRTQHRLNELNFKQIDRRIQFLKPFGFFDYIKLQMDSFCVVSDSGTITEEASLLKFPAITIRHTHERPEGMDAGTLVMTGLKRERVLESVGIVVSQHPNVASDIGVVGDYEVGEVSKKILRIVLSYTDFINRTVWNRPS